MCDNPHIMDMKALVIHGNKDIRVDDVAVPTPRSGEALLKIISTSICATDIEEWQHGPLWVQEGDANPISGRKMPLILGHEISGQIESLSDDSVDGPISTGHRVAVNNVRTCGICFWCRRGSQATCPNMCVAGLSADGGLAEYMTWPISHLIPLPDNIGDREAPLIEPTTVGVHAVRRSGVKLGDNVAVIGCGTVGLMTMQSFKAAGARVIAIDIREQSLRMASELGADDVIDSSSSDVAEALLDLTNGVGADIVAETAGARETPRLAIEWTRPGGKTVLVGIYSETPEVDFNQIVGTEKTVIGSVAAAPGDMEAAVSLISDGKIKIADLVSDVVSLDNVIQDGFERMVEPDKNVFRIVVSPNGDLCKTYRHSRVGGNP